MATFGTIEDADADAAFVTAEAEVGAEVGAEVITAVFDRVIGVMIAFPPNIVDIAIRLLAVSNRFKQSEKRSSAALASRKPRYRSKSSAAVGQPFTISRLNPGMLSKRRAKACEIGFCS